MTITFGSVLISPGQLFFSLPLFISLCPCVSSIGVFPSLKALGICAAAPQMENFTIGQSLTRPGSLGD